MTDALERARSKGLERAVQLDPDAVQRAAEAALRCTAALEPLQPDEAEFALKFEP